MKSWEQDPRLLWSRRQSGPRAYVGEHVTGAHTVFFENSGHVPFYEEPEKFNRVVRDFVLHL